MNIPPKLYKYQSWDYYAFNNLRQKHLWFSKPESFNDPFDCDINFTITDINEENINSLFNFCLESANDKKAFNAKYSQGGKFNNKFRDDVVNFALMATNLVKEKQWAKIGVACFSEDNDNILMWSHYTNSHQGFCLEFDTNCAPFKPTKTKNLLKVNYSESNSYPALSLKDIPNNLDLINTQLGTKSLHWKYENEWRLFSAIGNKEYPFDRAALTGVYFGCRMKNEDKNAIALILADLPTRLYQMQRSETEFKVASKEIFNAR